MSHAPSLPTPPRDRWPLVVALTALVAGVVLLGVALSGAFEHHPALPAPPAMPAVIVVTPAPAPSASAPAPTTATAHTARNTKSAKSTTEPSPAEQALDQRRFSANDVAHVPTSWVSGFYGIYAQAQKTYGVNWLLIASVHKQETAFSTHPTTYHGLNFANCCAGPMQFNVTNGSGATGLAGSTWARYRDAGAAAQRPAGYPHATTKHPSVYDDYDAIMAAAKLLRDSGGGGHLDASAWRAAYDYYGHDLTGVDYANEVVARAIGWGQKSFCINCGTDDRLLGAVDAAWGAPIRAQLVVAAEQAAKDKAKTEKAKKHRSEQAVTASAGAR
jgi:hypothetical protein